MFIFNEIQLHIPIVQNTMYMYSATHKKQNQTMTNLVYLREAIQQNISRQTIHVHPVMKDRTEARYWVKITRSLVAINKIPKSFLQQVS